MDKLVSRYNQKQTIVYSYSSDSLKLIYDTTCDYVSALKLLGFKTDDLFLFLIYSKLPRKTKEIWNERHTNADTLPKFNKILKFLDNMFRTLEVWEASKK